MASLCSRKPGDEVLGKEKSRIQEVELLVKDPSVSTLQCTAEQKRHATMAFEEYWTEQQEVPLPLGNSAGLMMHSRRTAVLPRH